MKLKKLLTTAMLIATMTAYARNEFSALEQQQVFVETPDLFKYSEAFTVDFGALRPSEYSFPLPVGKAAVQNDNSIKITTKKGDAVKAMFDGVVRLARINPQGNEVIVVRHDNGFETVYANNAQNLVKVGDKVKAGQTIAIVGTSKGETFCQFSILVNGCRINPNTVMNVSGHRLYGLTIMCRRAIGHVDVSVYNEERSLRQLGNSNKQAAAMEGNPFASGNEFTVNFNSFNPSEWCYPLANARVISPYGRRGGRSHTGVDLKTHPNDEVKAAFEGKVVRSGRFGAYGNIVVLRHSSGLETWYSHNSKNLVNVGDWVKAGQVIALTGRTGRATTEHLHFECRVNGSPINPDMVFDHSLHALRMDRLTFSKKGGRLKVSSNRNYMAEK